MFKRKSVNKDVYSLERASFDHTGFTYTSQCSACFQFCSTYNRSKLLFCNISILESTLDNMVLGLENGFGSSKVKNQVLAALTASYVLYSHGANCGWLSPALSVLLSNSTPLASGPLSNEELGWVGSMTSIGAICATFITAICGALWGSKRATELLAFPAIACWLFIYFGNNVYHILLARFCMGLTGGGTHSGVVLFISEISNDNIRGRLGSLVPLARNLGLLVAFIAGPLIKYEHRPFIFIMFPISYLFLAYFLPNTPQYYLKIDNLQEAENSLMYYKGCTDKTDQERSVVQAEFDRMKLLEEERRNRPKMQLKDFCNWTVLKGIGTCIAISWIQEVTGCFVIMNYASLIFNLSGTSFSADASAIILAVVQIIGGLTSTQLGDTLGRKITLFISLLGCSFGLFVFSTYLYMHHHGYHMSGYTWLPIVCLSFVMFNSSAGILALANTCVIENMPTKIRPAGMMFYSMINNLIAFVAGKSFPILVEIINLYGFMFLFAVNCCLGLIYVAFMKETKGTSLHTTHTK